MLAGHSSRPLRGNRVLERILFWCLNMARRSTRQRWPVEFRARWAGEFDRCVPVQWCRLMSTSSSGAARIRDCSSLVVFLRRLRLDLQRDYSVRVIIIWFEQIDAMRLKFHKSALGQWHAAQFNLAIFFNIIHPHHLFGNNIYIIERRTGKKTLTQLGNTKVSSAAMNSNTPQYNRWKLGKLSSKINGKVSSNAAARYGRQSWMVA